MRRTKGIRAAREVFKLGREDKRSSYQLYVAAADMEFVCTKVNNVLILKRIQEMTSLIFKDKAVALKIFQLGSKKFPNSNEFMLAYIKFMDHLNGCSLIFHL